MQTIKLTVVKTLVGSGNYMSPETTVSEIHPEGVLCVSNGTDLSVQEWEKGQFEW